MSEKENCRINELSKYDEMTTEELEEILRLDAEKTEGQESDTETILYIMGVLAERNKKNSQTGNSAQKAYEIFQQHYMPEIDNMKPVPTKKNKPKNRNPRWMRGLAAAAAVLVIVVFGSLTAKAFGVNVWKAVIQWTQETFHFGEWGNSNSNMPYASLQEALEKGNVPASLVPTWIPEGYNLVDVTAERSPTKKVYRAKYMNGEKTLRITVQDYLDQVPVYVEQSEGLVEEYEVSGITYYLFTDIDMVKAVWINGSYECDIMGSVTIEELKMMIDSIEKG